MSSVRVIAPAKVNPWLGVLGRRRDGYHEVELGMLALELADTVEACATESRGISLEVTGPAATKDIPTGKRNLAWRAAQAVLELRPRGDARGVALTLDKHVPSRAGLGGGSSDAAAACLATARALGLEASDAALVEILARLGSDCPFFLVASATGFARCTGRGELVEPLPSLWSDRWLVLVVPELEVPTAAVYANVSVPVPPVHGSIALAGSDAEVRATLYNDLERPALAAVPDLARWRSLLDAIQPGFRMSGSGSAFFVLFADHAAAAACASAVGDTAGELGLGTRGCWVTRPAGHGVR